MYFGLGAIELFAIPGPYRARTIPAIRLIIERDLLKIHEIRNKVVSGLSGLQALFNSETVRFMVASY